MRINNAEYIDSEDVCRLYNVTSGRFAELLITNYVRVMTQITFITDRCCVEASYYLRSDIEQLLAHQIIDPLYNQSGD